GTQSESEPASRGPPIRLWQFWQCRSLDLWQNLAAGGPALRACRAAGPAVCRNQNFTGAAMNRRHFLMSTAVMAGSAAIKGMAQSPNNRVRIAVIGLGGRGGSHVSAWSRVDNGGNV